jgi:hypothetical protein
VTHEGHEGWQGDAGVDEAGAVGVAELVRGDVQGRAVGAQQPGRRGGAVQAMGEAPFGGPAAPLDEYEVGQVPVAGVRDGPQLASPCHPGVQDIHGVGVQGDHPLGGELADRDPQPGAVGAEVDQAVQLEVEQLAHAHAGGPQQQQAGAGERVGQPGDLGPQGPVDLGGQGAGHGLGQAGQIGEEQQPAAGLTGPPPGGDVLEDHPQVDHVVVEQGERHGAAPPVGAAPWPGPGPCPGTARRGPPVPAGPAG